MHRTHIAAAKAFADQHRDDRLDEIAPRIVDDLEQLAATAR